MARIPTRGGGGRGGGGRVRGGGGQGRGHGRGRGRGRVQQQPLPLPVLQPPPPPPAAAAAAAAGGPTNQNYVLLQGLELVGFTAERLNVSIELKTRRFRAHFGMGPVSVARLFDNLKDTWQECQLPKLLMALNWLKLYDPEHVLSARWNLSEETLRAHIRIYVAQISNLKQEKIQFGGFGDEVFIVSLDGTHCPIFEPRTDPNSKWYSHKFHGPGLAYELAIAIHSNRLVWINGPFPASTHDITIFRSAHDPPAGLMAQIPHDKRAIGDSGYKGEPLKIAVTRDDDDAATKKFKARVKSRHENFNGRLKNFRILAIAFRHGHPRHGAVFEACCVCIQYEIENGNGLFEV